MFKDVENIGIFFTKYHLNYRNSQENSFGGKNYNQRHKYQNVMQTFIELSKFIESILTVISSELVKSVKLQLRQKINS